MLKFRSISNAPKWKGYFQQANIIYCDKFSQSISEIIQLLFWKIPKLTLLAFFVFPKYENDLEIDLLVTSVLIRKPLKNINLYSNSFRLQLFPNNYQLKLHRNANNANFGNFAKTRVLI